MPTTATTEPERAGARILVVDDEPDISALVAYHFARTGYRVQTAADGEETIHAVETDTPDLIVLDLLLPGMSGLEILKEIRRRPETERIPVILLTARGEEADRVAGLSSGADDYVPKPFSPRELVLRAGAVLNRVRQVPLAAAGEKVVRVGPFCVRTGAVRAEVSGRELDLTPTEYRLLLTLMERRGRVQSRQQLLEAAWGITARIATRTVDMHVQRLRGKLGEEGEWIETLRGFGYRFRAEPPRAASQRNGFSFSKEPGALRSSPPSGSSP